jgi:hypothetical protein
VLHPVNQPTNWPVVDYNSLNRVGLGSFPKTGSDAAAVIQWRGGPALLVQTAKLDANVRVYPAYILRHFFNSTWPIIAFRTSQD